MKTSISKMHGLHPSTLVLTLASLLTLVTSLPQPESHQARAPQMGHSNDHDSSTFTDAPVSYAQINLYVLDYPVQST